MMHKGIVKTFDEEQKGRPSFILTWRGSRQEWW